MGDECSLGLLVTDGFFTWDIWRPITSSACAQLLILNSRQVYLHWITLKVELRIVYHILLDDRAQEVSHVLSVSRRLDVGTEYFGPEEVASQIVFDRGAMIDLLFD